MVAKRHACRNVSTLEPTDVPNELATSLAPTPKARKNAIIKDSTKIQTTESDAGSNVETVAAISVSILQVFIQSANNFVNEEYDVGLRLGWN